MGQISVLAANCLFFVDLSDMVLHTVDFHNSSLSYPDLIRIQAAFACFAQSDFRNAERRIHGKCQS